MSETVLLPARTAALREETDVLVAGGGPAGIGAAMAAAREGLRVTLLEKRSFLGGNITDSHVGLCNHYLRNIPFESSGLYAEMEQRYYALYGRGHYIYDRERLHSEYMKIFLDDFVLNEGVRVVFHSFVSDVVCDGDRIQDVVVSTKSGPVAYRARMIVDATGDGDVAFFAGVPFAMGREPDHLVQPGTLMFSLSGVDTAYFAKQERGFDVVRDRLTRMRDEGNYPLMHNRVPYVGGLTDSGLAMEMNYSETYGTDPTDSDSLTEGSITARKQIAEFVAFLRQNIPGMERVELAQISSEIGFRDSRRFRGLYELTLDDIENDRRFEDSMFLFPRFYDLHALDGDWMQPDEMRKNTAKLIVHALPGRTFQVPYRCIVPEKINNLFVTGRCLSADHEAESAIRQVYACMQSGQAAGIAAGLSIRNNTTPAGVDTRALKARLIQQNVVV